MVFNYISGVAASFVTGALGGAAGQRIMQLTSGITSTAARYFANINLFANVNVLNSVVGAVIEHIGNNIFGDKPFDGQKFGGSLMNGLVQSFVPGSWNTAVGSLLGNVGDWLLDPSKSLSEKWQVSCILVIELFEHIQILFILSGVVFERKYSFKF